MDTTDDIIYRTFTLNDADIADTITGGGGAGSGVRGCVVDNFDLSDVDVIQFLEKRSQSDGMDAGVVELGTRRIRAAGTLYSLSRAQLFDDYFLLRKAFSPVLAMRESPADMGYRPLYFSVPTERTDADDYPSGRIDLQVYALPRAISATFDRDRSGGASYDPLALPWQATLICKDPGIYGVLPIEVALGNINETTGTTGAAATDLFTKTGHGLVADDRVTFRSLTGGTGLSTGVTYWVISSGLTANAFKLSLTQGGAAVNFSTDVTVSVWVKSFIASGTWRNRGTYLSPLSLLAEVGAGAGTITMTVGDATFTITVPSSTGNRIIRLWPDKHIDFEEDDVVTPRMDVIEFSGTDTWPLIGEGDTPYSVAMHGMGGVVYGSRMWFYEQYA